MSDESMEAKSLICITLFLLAYSAIYVLSTLVNHLSNNFANGLLFFYIRFKKCINSMSFVGSFSSKLKLVTFINLIFLFPLIYCLVAFTPLTYCLIHFFFTLMMLNRFLRSKNLELKIGRTTCTTLICSVYPIIFLLLLAVTLVHLPHCLDWIFSKIFSQKTLIQHLKNLLTVHLKDLILILSLVLIVSYIYLKPLDLQIRFHSFQLNRTQKLLNITLLLISFLNMIFSTLALVNLNICIVLTLWITLGHLLLIHSNNMRSNNNSNLFKEFKEFKSD